MVPLMSRHTAMLNDSDSIKVAVRVRPMNATELQRGDPCVLQIDPEEGRQVKLLLTPTPSLTQGLGLGPGGAGSPGAAGVQMMERAFPFHVCVGPEASQADVMRLCGINQLLDAALDGYNVTILAVSLASACCT